MNKKKDSRPDRIKWHGRNSGRSCGCVLDIREDVKIHCEEVGAIECFWEGLPPLFMCPQHYREAREKNEPTIKDLVEKTEWAK
jgi:hypothetical protein